MRTAICLCLTLALTRCGNIKEQQDQGLTAYTAFHMHQREGITCSHGTATATADVPEPGSITWAYSQCELNGVKLDGKLVQQELQGLPAISHHGQVTVKHKAWAHVCDVDIKTTANQKDTLWVVGNFCGHDAWDLQRRLLQARAEQSKLDRQSPKPASKAQKR